MRRLGFIAGLLVAIVIAVLLALLVYHLTNPPKPAHSQSHPIVAQTARHSAQNVTYR